MHATNVRNTESVRVLSGGEDERHDLCAGAVIVRAEQTTADAVLLRPFHGFVKVQGLIHKFTAALTVIRLQPTVHAADRAGTQADRGTFLIIIHFSSFLVLYEINFTAVQTYRQHRAILCRKLRVPSFQGGVYGKTDVNISPKTMLDGSLTLLMLGENQKLKSTSTCKNLYR